MNWLRSLLGTWPAFFFFIQGTHTYYQQNSQTNETKQLGFKNYGTWLYEKKTILPLIALEH